MVDLTTNISGISFPNPFVLAAAPTTAKSEMIIEAFKAGWSGAVLKTIGLVPTQHPCPRVHVIKSGKHRQGLLDIELISEKSIEQWGKEIDRIRDAFPDRPIIASIMGGSEPNDWQEVVQRLEPHGINGFEMNASCPNYDEKMGGKLGQDPKALSTAVKWVKKVPELPVIVKLTPNVTDILTITRVAVAAGADAFNMGNSLSGLAGIDLDKLTPLPTVVDRGIIGGYNGPGLTTSEFEVYIHDRQGYAHTNLWMRWN